MKKESVVILQKFGLGDIIFCQSIAHYYIRGGFRVYWPVVHQYLSDLKRAYPDIRWIAEDWYHAGDRAVRYDLLHSLVAPLQWSNTFMNDEYRRVMKNKYDMYGLDWTNWKKDAMWNRDYSKELALADMHGIRKGDKFNLVQKTFGGGDFAPITVPIQDPMNGLKTVHIKKIDGYSLFDWALMMEWANEIHFVSSSNIYMLEMLKLSAQCIAIYPRIPREADHRNYDYILKSHTYDLR